MTPQTTQHTFDRAQSVRNSFDTLLVPFSVD